MKTFKTSSEGVITMRDDAMKRYFAEICKYPVMSAEEEAAVAERWVEKHDTRDRDKLVNSNLRFVVTIAKQYYISNKFYTLTDLVNEGNIGLIEAAERFDPTRGFRFCSYSVWWIRQKILRFVEKHGGFIRLPSNKRVIYNKLNRIVFEFEQENQAAITLDLLAERAGMSKEEVMEIVQAAQPSCSIDKNVGDEDDLTLANLISSESVTDAEAEASDLRKVMADVIGELPERERTVLILHPGFGGESMTFEQIGENLGMTRERCRQIFYSACQTIATRFPHLKSYLAA